MNVRGITLVWLVLVSWGSQAEVLWDTQEQRFEPAPQEESVVAIFGFTNTGDTPVQIERVRTACGCTVPSYERAPLGAGDSSALLVEFSFVRKFQPQRKHVAVFFVGEEQPHVLWIAVERPQKLAFSSSYLSWRVGNELVTKQSVLTQQAAFSNLRLLTKPEHAVVVLKESRNGHWTLTARPTHTETPWREALVLRAESPTGEDWEWRIHVGVLPNQ